MKIAVVGTGYVGLVSGTCFAETGNDVTCIDIDANKVAMMKQGIVPIYEPGLEFIFKRNIKHNRLKFTTNLDEGIKGAEVIFLALPTPPDEDGSADLRYVLGVAKDLSQIIASYVVIVDKSTVPVGTADRVVEVMSEKLSRDLFDVVSNPEFLREGAAVEDFLKPERVVIGTSSERAKKIMESLYEPFFRIDKRIIFMDERSAELTKYAANAFLATKITFMNEIANICEFVGADVDNVRMGIGTDERIGKKFLFAGVGYGGSCFPKDVSAIYQTARKSGYDFRIIDAVITVNQMQKTMMSKKIIEKFGKECQGKTIAIWGLAFKPNTDDIREAPALYMIEELLEAGFAIRVYDPEAMPNVRNKIGEKIIYGKNQYKILENADALLLVTEWSAFRSPDFSFIKAQLRQPLIFDGRNIFKTESMEEHGFEYYSVGRPAIACSRD